MRTSTPHTFTAEKRAAVLVLMEAGYSMAEAAERVGVNRNTVTNYANAGRENRSPDHVEFAARFDRALGRDIPEDEGLTKRDLVRLLEKSAKNGSVQAIKLLLQLKADPNLFKQRAAEQPEEKPKSIIDELAQRRAAAGGQ